MMRFILIATLLLSSCFKNEFEDKMQSFVGKDYQSIVDYWGLPTNSYTLPNGNDVYHYLRLKDRTSSVNNHYDSEGIELEKWCDIFFEIGKDLKILKYDYEGNYCWED